MQCRMCWGDGDGAYCQPCACDGTAKWIHLGCLQQWIDKHGVWCPQCHTYFSTACYRAPRRNYLGVRCVIILMFEFTAVSLFDDAWFDRTISPPPTVALEAVAFAWVQLVAPRTILRMSDQALGDMVYVCSIFGTVLTATLMTNFMVGTSTSILKPNHRSGRIAMVALAAFYGCLVGLTTGRLHGAAVYAFARAFILGFVRTVMLLGALSVTLAVVLYSTHLEGVVIRAVVSIQT